MPDGPGSCLFFSPGGDWKTTLAGEKMGYITVGRVVMKKSSGISRRSFLQSATVATAAPAVLASRSAGSDVPSGPALKVGVVGCGGRGSGAAANALAAAPNIQVAALADVFELRVERMRQYLESLGQQLPSSRCFVGFEAYRKLLDTDVDYVVLATPPHFRPEHFSAVVDAGKHAFIEKPAGVDPVGIRQMFAAAVRSEKKGLCVAAGTQRRHALQYIETRKRIADGAIGEILSARGYWNQGAVWYRLPRPEWDEMSYML